MNETPIMSHEDSTAENSVSVLKIPETLNLSERMSKLFAKDEEI